MFKFNLMLKIFIELYYIQGKSYSEISEDSNMGISIDKIRTLYESSKEDEFTKHIKEVKKIHQGVKSRHKKRAEKEGEKECSKWVFEDFSWGFPEFYEWYKERQDSCHYCKSDPKSVSKFLKTRNNKRTNRGARLEVDRLKDHIGYKESNCVMACYICNNAKSDFLSENEAVELGKVIKSFIK